MEDYVCSGLGEALKRASRGVKAGTPASIEVREGIDGAGYIMVDHGRCTLKAMFETDPDLSISPRRIDLCRLRRVVPAEAPVTMRINDAEDMVVEAQGIVAAFPLDKAAEGKALPVWPGEVSDEGFDGITNELVADTDDDVDRALRGVALAADEDLNRPVLGMVCVERHQDDLTLVATEMHWLCHHVIPLPTCLGTWDTLLLPARALKLLREPLARVRWNDKWTVLVGRNGTRVVTPALNPGVSFPNWRRVVPRVAPVASLVVLREELRRAIGIVERRGGGLPRHPIRDEWRVYINFATGALESGDDECGPRIVARMAAESTLEDGAYWEIAIASCLLRQVLKSADRWVRINWGGVVVPEGNVVPQPQALSIFTGNNPDDLRFCAVVMPMGYHPDRAPSVQEPVATQDAA